MATKVENIVDKYVDRFKQEIPDFAQSYFDNNVDELSIMTHFALRISEMLREVAAAEGKTFCPVHKRKLRDSLVYHDINLAEKIREMANAALEAMFLARIQNDRITRQIRKDGREYFSSDENHKVAHITSQAEVLLATLQGFLQALMVLKPLIGEEYLSVVIGQVCQTLTEDYKGSSTGGKLIFIIENMLRGQGA